MKYPKRANPERVKSAKKQADNLLKQLGQDIVNADPLAEKVKNQIDDIFNEILFKMWMSGRTLVEIVEAFKNTNREFTPEALSRAKSYFRWDERRGHIVAALKQDTDTQIKLSRRKQLGMVQMAIDMNFKLIENEYIEFLKDPEQYIANYAQRRKCMPAWLARDPKEMFELFKAHNFVVNDGFKGTLDLNANKKSNVNLTPEEEAQIWAVMRNAATRQVLPSNTIAVDALPVNSEEDIDE